MKAVVEFIKIKHNSLVQFAGAVIAMLGLFDVIDWSTDQTNAVLLVTTLFFVLFGAQTVTANARLTGNLVEGFSGADNEDVLAKLVDDITPKGGNYKLQVSDGQSPHIIILDEGTPGEKMVYDDGPPTSTGFTEVYDNEGNIVDRYRNGATLDDPTGG